MRTVRDQVNADIADGRRRTIYAAAPAPCVVCGDVLELRYGVCFDCAAITSFDDPRVKRDEPVGPIDQRGRPS